MRSVILLCLICAACQLGAKEVTISLDSAVRGRSLFPNGALRIGYATDPVAGGEDAALLCRRAGAWSFRSSKCDDATLAFLAKYGLRVFLLLNGEAKEMIETLNRIGKGPYAKVIMGVQIGNDPADGANAEKWRTVARVAAKNFPGRPIALPVNDERSPILTESREPLSFVTHLMVDLRGEVAPYAKLSKLALALRASSERNLKKIRLWTIASCRLPGQTGGQADSPAALAWQAHWVMSALAVDTVDGVFFDRLCGKDDFGLLMRNLWTSLYIHPTLIAHGEGASTVTVGKKKSTAPVIKMDLDDEDIVMGGESIEETMAAGNAPQACANVAAGRTGDLEYLAFIEKAGAPEDTQICLFVVNTSGERVRLKVNLKSKSGLTGPGFRSSLTPDVKTGGMFNRTTERLHDPLKPFGEWIEPGEIAFMDFRI